MPVETDAERLALLQHLGEQIAVAGVSVWAVFDNAYAEALGLAGTQPVAACRSTDVAAVTTASTVVRGATTYRVVGIEPDGTGMTLLVLQRQA